MKKVTSLAALFVAAVFVLTSCSNPIFDSAGNLNTNTQASNNETVLVFEQIVPIDSNNSSEIETEPEPEVEINTQNSSKITILNFASSNCEYSVLLDPILDEVKSEFGDKIELTRIDAISNRSLMAQYDITGVPTQIWLRNGEIVGRMDGWGPGIKGDIVYHLGRLLNE